MTFASDPRPGEHDWQSLTCVEQWVASSNSRADRRRPMLRRLARLLPLERATPSTVLDVGGGHGELTVQVLEEWPASTVVLQDVSGPMLDIAAERLSSYGERVRFAQGDLTEPGWSKSLGGPFDSVVSSIAIHNVGEAATIRAIYEEIATLVVAGGAFFNLDYVFMPGEAVSDLYAKAADRPVPTHDHAAARPGEPASLLNQLRWLEAAGFDEVDCAWKDLRQSMLCAFRTADLGSGEGAGENVVAPVVDGRHQHR